MFITTFIEIDLETGEVLAREGYEYSGPMAYCIGWGGATSQQKQIAASDDAFMQSLQGEQKSQFANELNAQNQLNKAWSPILAGGPYQYGFSTAEDQALRSDIVNQGATAATNTENAALTREQQASGGASATPTGGQQAINAQIAATGAQDTAANLAKEKLQGYEQGANLFEDASKGVSTVASLADPTGYANAANQSENAAATAEQDVQEANANSIGSKMLGGLFNAGLNLATGGIAKGLGIQLPSGPQNAGGVCWIAAEVYGEDLFGPRTTRVRNRLLEIEHRNFVTKFIVGLYRKHGQQTAKIVAKSRALKKLFRLIFDRLKAEENAN